MLPIMVGRKEKHWDFHTLPLYVRTLCILLVGAKCLTEHVHMYYIVYFYYCKAFDRKASDEDLHQ